MPQNLDMQMKQMSKHLKNPKFIFIDKYISCSLPDNDQALRDLVEGLQIHRHSPTCRRKGRLLVAECINLTHVESVIV